ncbi:hypothetical protein B296_00043637 [Ensete ventricosum]|uniref:Gibberellin-regulated protein n=1 Tax=Ensete ventricosum TaxID=4639 RepID=A0A426XVY9_ENSVE|nr:hypothetical protein B296_00043637 [Ensete ventricosum]
MGYWAYQRTTRHLAHANIMFAWRAVYYKGEHTVSFSDVLIVSFAPLYFLSHGEVFHLLGCASHVTSGGGESVYCPGKCSHRCSKASRHKMCMRACIACCHKCHCVPHGTHGHKEECPCYAHMKTHHGKPKCP